MAARVRLKWNQAEFRRILQQDEVPRGVARAAGRVRDRSKANLTRAGRVDTGALRNSITVRQASSGAGRVTYQVGSDLRYALPQHQGVKGPVLPRRAKVLRFKPKGSNTFIFRPQTKGFKGVPYLRDALRSLKPSDFYN